MNEKVWDHAGNKRFFPTLILSRRIDNFQSIWHGWMIIMIAEMKFGKTSKSCLSADAARYLRNRRKKDGSLGSKSIKQQGHEESKALKCSWFLRHSWMTQCPLTSSNIHVINIPPSGDKHLLQLEKTGFSVALKLDTIDTTLFSLALWWKWPIASTWFISPKSMSPKMIPSLWS